MTSAEIITIGTEILLGEIVDTNSAFLARRLRDRNVDVFRTSTVGDNTQRIAATIREALARTQIIITTGGLGPTVDDPTREAVALAFGLETEYRPELWKQIVERMQRYGRTAGENQKRQAYMPEGAIAVRNAVGTAPAFIVERGDQCLISLPGVPGEMEYLTENEVVPYLVKRYKLVGTIKARVLHIAGVGEGVIDEQVGDLELLANPTVGLAAHYGVVDVRITAKAESTAEADSLISHIETIVREKLGPSIYGTDEQTLEDVTLQALAARGWNVTVVEVDTGGELSGRLAGAKHPAFIGGQVLTELSKGQSLAAAVASQQKASAANAAIGLAVHPIPGSLSVDIILALPDGTTESTRTYGGHPKNLSTWGSNLALDALRREIGG